MRCVFESAGTIVHGAHGVPVAATAALHGIRGSSERYGLPVALAVLKLPTGAVTAFLGLLLVEVFDLQTLERVGGPIAIGDVAGEPMLAHKAAHEGKLAVQVLLGEPMVWEPRAIPAVVFTDPEAVRAAVVTLVIAAPFGAWGTGRAATAHPGTARGHPAAGTTAR